MIAALLLVISLAALAQFALYYWRALVLGVAAQPLSERFREASPVGEEALGGQSFGALLQLYEMTPQLRVGKSRLGTVRMYYRAVEMLGRLTGKLMPQVEAWSEREMATCTRYVAVRVDQRMTRNMECAAALRSC